MLVAAGIGYLATRHMPVIVLRQTVCSAGTATDKVELSASQAGIAATIAGVASERAMPVRAVAIAYAAALQESKLANLRYGDRDSVGVFQQRPSQGWGTAQQIEDPVYASGRFFAALAKVPHYRRMPIYVAAQDVQHSADGAAYGKYAAEATALAQAFSGALPHAVSCEFASSPGKASLAAAGKAISTAFGPLARRALADPAMSLTVSGTRQGWAIASWLVSNAASYGIRHVWYLGYQWAGFSGSGHWTRQPAGPPAPGPSGTPSGKQAGQDAPAGPGTQADPTAVAYG